MAEEIRTACAWIVREHGNPFDVLVCRTYAHDWKKAQAISPKVDLENCANCGSYRMRELAND